jgi:peptide/nickel transport system substrate-binding protein
MRKETTVKSLRRLALVAFILLLPAALVVAAATGPLYGGTFVIGIAAEPGGLNPIRDLGSDPQICTSPIFSTLLKLDMKGNPMGDLAESWGVAADKTTITFHLRKGVKWHNGTPLTSADVLYTFMGSRDGYLVHSRYKSSLDPLVQSYETPDANTFIIKLKAPFAPFLRVFSASNYALPIVSKAIFEGTDVAKNPSNWAPIGSGPFKFKEWVKGSHIELVRNDDYYVKGQPYIDKLMIRFMPDETSRLLAIQQGEIDYLYYYAVPYSAIPDLKANKDIVITTDGAGMQGLVEMWYFNLLQPPFDKLEVRQAFAYLLDRNKMNDSIFYGFARPTTTVLGATTPFASETVTTKYNLGSEDKNVAMANKLLDQAGYPRKADGMRFKTQLLYMSGRPYAGKEGEVVNDTLRKVGIELEMVPMDRAAFIDKTHSKWDYTISEQQLSSSAHPFVGVPRYLQWSTHKPGLYPSDATGYNNPKIEALFTASTNAASETEEAKIWAQAQKMLSDDLPVLPIVEMPYTNCYRAEWKDVFASTDGVFDVGRTVWWTKGKPAK